MTTYPRTGDPLSAGVLGDGSTISHLDDHGRNLHNPFAYANVMHYGAVGDNSHDDTAAIQAAISALTFGSAIRGTLVIPFTFDGYKITSPIVIGDGSKYVSLDVRGETRSYQASDGLLAATMLKPSTANTNAIQVNFATSLAQSLIIEGIQVQYASVGTGIGLDLTIGAQAVGTQLRHFSVQKGGVGVKLGGSVNFRASECSMVACDKGWLLTASGGGNNPNVAQFDNCYFQSSVTAGLSVETLVYAPRFNSCVFQSNVGPGILINGAITGGTFVNCWWEFPGSDMIRLVTGTSGFCLDSTTFIGCQLDGSVGAGGRHVINNTAAAGSGVFGRELSFINCNFVNLNGGKVLNIATDPSNSSDPGYLDIVILGAAGGGDLKGLHTPTSLGGSPGGHHNIFKGRQITDAMVLASAISGEKPAYTRWGGDSNVVTRNDLGAIEFTEVTAPAAPAANKGRLYVEDTGGGKSRLVVRFPSGAAQVIATEP